MRLTLLVFETISALVSGLSPCNVTASNEDSASGVGGTTVASDDSQNSLPYKFYVQAFNKQGDQGSVAVGLTHTLFRANRQVDHYFTLKQGQLELKVGTQRGSRLCSIVPIRSKEHLEAVGCYESLRSTAG